MSQTGSVGEDPRAPAGSGLALLPPVWVGIVILLSVRGIYSGWPAIYSQELPDRVLYLVYAGLAAATVNILWGLWLLGLALGRSASFARQFTIWQIVNIVRVVLHQAYVLVTPDFVVTLVPMLYAAAEIAIGLFCIHIVRRDPTGAAAAGRQTGRPSFLVSLIAAVLGIIIGGGLGFGAGLGIGVFISEATDMSCFEGACGFFAFFVGVFGMIAGAVAGAILAVWLVHRPRPAPAV